MTLEPLRWNEQRAAYRLGRGVGCSAGVAMAQSDQVAVMHKAPRGIHKGPQHLDLGGCQKLWLERRSHGLSEQ